MKLITAIIIATHLMPQLVRSAEPVGQNAAIYRELADQVVQNQIFLDAYKLNLNRDDLTSQANQAYAAQKEKYKDVLSSTIGLSFETAGSIALMQSIPPQYYSLKLKVLAFYSIGLGSLSLYQANAGTQVRSRSSRAREQQRISETLLDGTNGDLKELVRQHSEIVGNFFCLKPTELARFRSALENAAVNSAKTGQSVDSIQLLFSMGLINGDFAKAIKHWRDLARASMGSKVRLNEQRILFAELNHLACTSAVMKAYLNSEEGQQLNANDRERVKKVIANSDAMLARAYLLVH